MSKKLTFEIDFEVNGRKLAIISEKINKVFNQSIKTNVSDELLKQINALKDLEKTSVKTASELEKAYKKSEKALKDTTKATKDHAKAVKDTASTDANKLVAENAKRLSDEISRLSLSFRKNEISAEQLAEAYEKVDNELTQLPATNSKVIATQTKLLNAQDRLKNSSANLNTNLRGTNNTLLNLGRVIQDAPFGILGVANNIDPLVNSFQNLGKEAGGSGKALKAMLAGLTGPAGLAIGVSAVTSLMIAYGDDILEFFTKPTLDAEEASSAFTKQLKEQSDALNQIAGNKKASLEANKTELSVIQEQIKALEEMNKQTKESISTAQQGVENARRGTGIESEKTKNLKQEALIQSEILKQLRDKSQIIQGEIAGQDLFNRLNGDQKKILDDIVNSREKSIELIKEAKAIEFEDITDFVDFNIERQQEQFKFAETQNLIAKTALESQLEFERQALENQANYKVELEKKQWDRQLEIRDIANNRFQEILREEASQAILLEQYKQDAILSIRQNAFDFSTNLVGALEGFGLISAKKAFGINKALGIADATINTYKGVTAALAQPLPPPLPQIDAGIRLANGLAQVAKIASTKFSTGGGGGASGGGGSVNVPNPNIVRPTFSAPSSTLSQQNEDRLKSSNATVILNVQNNLDRQGLALAVREGSDELNARSVTIKSV